VQTIYRNDLCRFEIRGPFATSLLRNPATFSVSFQDTNVTAAAAWKQIINETNANAIQRGMAISLVVNHPLTAAPAEQINVADSLLAASSSTTTTTTTSSNNVKQQKHKIPNLKRDIRSALPHGIAHCNALWKHYRERAQLSSSASTQQKMDLVSTPNDDDAESAASKHSQQQQKKISTTSMSDRKRKRLMTAKDKRLPSYAIPAEKTAEVLLVQVPSSDCDPHMGSGWDMICSFEVAAHFWSKFAKTKHVLPLPLYDRNRMMTEQGYVEQAFSKLKQNKNFFCDVTVFFVN